MNEIVTTDWSKFGKIEIKKAKELLSHIKDIDSCGKVEVYFNMNSGNVFLCDENYRVWMMNGEDIEEWFFCSYCGNEGFIEDFEDYNENCEGCVQINKNYDGDV